MSISHARRRALDARAEVRTGRDPRAEIAERKDAERRGQGKRVGNLVHDYLAATESQLRKETLRGYRGMLARLEQYHARFAERPASEVTRGEARILLDRVAARARGSLMATDGHTTMNRTHGLLGSVFSWALEREVVDANPFAGLRLQKLSPRQIVFKPAEVAAILRALEELRGAGDTSGFYFELLWLTNVRPDEAVRARWRHFDRMERLWTLPGDLTKTRSDRPVPLSEQAFRLVAALGELGRSSDYLFPSRAKSGHIEGAGGTARRERVRKLSRVPHFTAKSIQHTIATLMVEQLGIDGRLVDLCKGHLPPKMARTYNRAFWEIDAQRGAFEKWGQYLDRLAGRATKSP